MQIELHPISVDDVESYGIFRMAAADCLNYLRDHFRDSSVRLDGEFLQWMERQTKRETASTPNGIPDIFDGRARFMVIALWDNGSPLTVFCTRCGQTIPMKDLSKPDWEDTSISGGIKAGASGFHVLCPDGHMLLTITTRIY